MNEDISNAELSESEREEIIHLVSQKSALKKNALKEAHGENLRMMYEDARKAGTSFQRDHARFIQEFKHQEELRELQRIFQQQKESAMFTSLLGDSPKSTILGIFKALIIGAGTLFYAPLASDPVATAIVGVAGAVWSVAEAWQGRIQQDVKTETSK